VAIFAALAGGALMMSGTTEKSEAVAAPACKGWISATGNSSAIQYLASTSSKYAWKAKANKRFGAAYDTWGNAKNKGVNCKKAKEGGLWTCTASGTACR
jgi:hypothetical protein